MAQNAIIVYMRNMNRPYSVNDIMLNLHNEYGKSAVQKALDTLVEENKIREKCYGKQKVYSVIQEETNNTSDTQAELEKIQTQINENTENLQDIAQKIKTAEQELHDLHSILTTDEAMKQNSELKGKIEKMERKLTALSENTIIIEPKERDNVKKQYEQCVKEYRKRKRICMDVMDTILESYPKDKKCMIEEIGLEMEDNMFSVTLS